jgi:hypothetical protein
MKIRYRETPAQVGNTNFRCENIASVTYHMVVRQDLSALQALQAL